MNDAAVARVVQSVVDRDSLRLSTAGWTSYDQPVSTIMRVSALLFAAVAMTTNVAAPV